MRAPPATGVVMVVVEPSTHHEYSALRHNDQMPSDELQIRLEAGIPGDMLGLSVGTATDALATGTADSAASWDLATSSGSSTSAGR